MSQDDIVFKALADSTRRIILTELSERHEQTLYELRARLIMRHNIEISRQGIEKHLKVLEKAGLVKFGRRGRFKMLFFIDEPIKRINRCWFSRFLEKSD